MQSLRLSFDRYRGLTVLLLAFALLVRLLVPTGFMPVANGGSITIQLCTGMGAQTIEIPTQLPEDRQHGQQQADQPCAFAGLALSCLPAVDVALLAVVIALMMATALRLSPFPARRFFPYLRPPLRGPPTHV